MTETQGASRAALYVLVGSLGIQTSAALASGLFEEIGPNAASALRLTIAAALMLLLFRPSIRGLSAGQWRSVAIYGVAMAAMNLCLYQAIARLPLGIAVTLDFLGPCLVSFWAARRLADRLWAVLALIGVFLIAGPANYFDPVGFAFGLAAGFFFAMYTVYAEKVGKGEMGLSGLALSVAVAAVVSLPFGLPRVPDVSAHAWGVLLICSLIGVMIPYIVDTLAAKVSSARVVGTLFSLDPVIGALLGAVLLDQHLNVAALIGIGVVIFAGAALTWTAGRATPTPSPPMSEAIPARRSIADEPHSGEQCQPLP